MPWVGLQCVVVVIHDHTHLLFIAKSGTTNLPFMYPTPGNEQISKPNPIFFFVFRINIPIKPFKTVLFIIDWDVQLVHGNIKSSKTS